MRHLEKHTAQELFARANSLYGTGLYAESLACLRQLDEVYSNNSAILFAMALCHEGLDQRDEALRYCDHLIGAFKHDKAMVLKARLITIPSDPPPEVMAELAEQRATRKAWPEPEIAFCAETRDAALSQPQHEILGRYVGPTIIAIALLALLPIFVTLLAQADTTAPGALPTLFPGRLVLIYAFCTWGMTMPFLASMLKENALLSVRLAESALYAALCLMPVAGWIATAALLRYRHDLPLSRGVQAIILLLALQVAAALLIAYTLDLASFRAIYFEIKAGYG